MILIITQLVIGSMFFIVGILKLVVLSSQLKERMGSWTEDFSASQIKIIGLIEMFGGALLIRRMVFDDSNNILEPFGLFFLAVIMAGAVYTHIRRKEEYLHALILGAIIITLLAFKLI